MIDKKTVDDWIPNAYEALESPEIAIAKGGKINRAYRGQIAAFGASIINGSLLSAVVSFSNSSSKKNVDPTLLVKAIEKILTEKDKNGEFKRATEGRKAYLLYHYVSSETKTLSEEQEKQDRIMEAATALKLAMNLFELSDTGQEQGEAENDK